MIKWDQNTSHHLFLRIQIYLKLPFGKWIFLKKRFGNVGRIHLVQCCIKRELLWTQQRTLLFCGRWVILPSWVNISTSRTSPHEVRCVLVYLRNLFHNHPWTKYPSSLSITKKCTDITMKDVYLLMKIGLRVRQEHWKQDSPISQIRRITLCFL
jgi:hypothetical protein